MRKKYFTEEEKKKAKSESSKKYYKTERGRTLKAEYDKKYKQENLDYIKNYRRSRRKSKVGYLDRFLERAKEKTPDTDLTRQDIEEVFGDFCCITGKKFEYIKEYDAYHNALAPSIDRIDSKKGYYVGNIQIILSCINRMKNDMPNDQFLELWKALTQ